MLESVNESTTSTTVIERGIELAHVAELDGAGHEIGRLLSIVIPRIMTCEPEQSLSCVVSAEEYGSGDIPVRDSEHGFDALVRISKKLAHMQTRHLVYRKDLENDCHRQCRIMLAWVVELRSDPVEKTVELVLASHLRPFLARLADELWAIPPEKETDSLRKPAEVPALDTASYCRARMG
ncbi:MAG: hypothetical protein OXF88_15970 [Rhodobacteraceae bacterium]|nr:hypothetical protein [Paracoccaceae bacterium]